MNNNRRTFLTTAAVGSMAMVKPVYGAAQNRKLQLGVIGLGNYGMADSKAALNTGGAEIAAVCDVDSDVLNKNADALAKLQGKRPKTFKLYEHLLEEKNLDAIIITTPPHWHALQFIAALQQGFDVYCEKPLAYDIREGRAMVDAAEKYGKIVQIGFQRRQSQAIRQAKEYIQDGKAGNIVQVDVQIHYTAGTKDPTPQNPPASLDWDLWCGPGPKIPYSPQTGHFNWRLEKRSGHGHLVDWGIHYIDATRVVLDLSTPDKVIAAGGLYYLKGKITTPDTLTVHFEFDRCPVVWRHRLWGSQEFTPEFNRGIFFYGEKASLFATDDRWVVLPKGRNPQPKEYTIKTDMGLNHMAEFLQGVRTQTQPSCSPEEGFRSTATVQLGMIAYETESTVHWDETTETISDNPDASRLLKRDYRKPWVHPYTG